MTDHDPMGHFDAGRHPTGRGHGHQHDQGLLGLLRYLRLLPHMWASDVGEEVVRQVAPTAGERVVDLGAGMGSASVIAARTGASVVAVDPTSYMRRILGLRRRWRHERRAITVVDGAAESIPVADASIDALWTVNTIHHWTDRGRAARELARVLRPGGRVMLVDEDFDNPAHPFHARHRSGEAKHSHKFEAVDPEAIAASLREAGFASALGSRAILAGRPAKVIRATR